ncbi:MAG: heme exporter protein CcmB [Bacteroidetes bacterium]|nr:heme exporter protein CcmB [Bacteroidota bacterium]
MHQVSQLVKLFFVTEWRQKFAVQGVIIQMFTSVFLIFLSINFIEIQIWNALFWLMVLFNTMNIIARGFLSETEGKMIYYHSICKPESLILSKIIFNSVVSLFLLLVFLSVYSIVLGFKIKWIIIFIILSGLFTIGLSAVFTLVSAIAQNAGNNYILIPVLGLPLMIPLVMTTIKSSKKMFSHIIVNSVYYDLAALFLLIVMIFYLAVILYKFLWKN